MSVNPTTPWGPVSLVPPAEGTEKRILDVALALFTRQGISATTMSQIAAEAGISRVWLYRYFENRDAVVRALIGREAKRFLAGLIARDDPNMPVTDSVISAFDHVVVTLRSHELLQRVLLTEPEVLAPFLASGTGPVLRIAVDSSAGFLQARAGMSPAEARAVAETMLRLVMSIVVNNDTTIDFDDPRQRRAFARRIIPKLLAANP